MSDPIATDDPEEGDLTLDPTARPERSRTLTRTFTPGLDARAAPNIPFRRVVSRESGPEEDLEALEARPAEPPPASWDTADVANLARARGQLLPALQRNRTFDFLESVHQQTDPAAMEHRLSKAFRISAVVLLIGVVATVLGSSIHFRARPVPAAAPAATAVPRAPVSEEAIDPQSLAAEGIAALRAFLSSTAAAERQQMIGADEPMPACLNVPGQVPALEKSTLSPEGARTVLLGRQVAVLVPMVDPAGLARTAAVLRHGGRFRVDWRSVMTPEPMAWEEFVAAPVDEPRLFRVELSAGADPAQRVSALTALRPTGTPRTVALSVEPRSRLAEDLGAAFNLRGGKSLPADVYLQGKPGEPLRIVGWTPDKWAL